MKPGARLQTAIELLDRIEAESGKPADAVLADGFRARRYAGSKDRSAIAEVVYGVLRHRAQLDWWLEKRAMEPGGRTRALAFAVLTGRYEAAALPTTQSEGDYAVAALSAQEADWLAALDGGALADPDQPAAVASNLPEWVVNRFRDQFGAGWEAQARALMNEAPVDIRANLLKTTRDDLAERLRDDGIEAAPCRLSPVGIRLTQRRPLTGVKPFKEGLLEVQDEGSQLVALLVDAKPGQKVVDFCAGAGGKTLAIAGQMENRGRIVACDTSEARLNRAADRLKRAGSFTVERRVLTSAKDKWVKRRAARFDGGFDRVLVDAPCTGSGTWRRNPDQKWRVVEADLAELTRLQSEILDSAARLVAPGGRLVYATCSLLKDENEDRLAAFLEQRPDFFLYPYADIWRETVGGAPPVEGDMLRLTPADHGTDGFFAAVLGRKL